MIPDRLAMRNTLLITWFILGALATHLLGQEQTAAPILVVTQTRQSEKVAGTLAGFDESSFTVIDSKGKPRRIPWSDLDSRNVYALHQRFFGRSATAGQWFELGRRLADAGDKTRSDAAFAHALKLDPNLAPRVQQVQATAQYRPDPPPATPRGSSRVEPSPPATDPLWTPLSPDESAAAIEELHQFALDAQKQIAHPGLARFETPSFLLYTDLDAREAQKWSRLLDRAYARLCALFAISGTDLWHGKALVLVFRSDRDYARYAREVAKFPVDPWTTPAFHQALGPRSLLASYRWLDDTKFAVAAVDEVERAQEEQLAHALAHEATHGFVHRYRSGRAAPSWVNEGLAEWLAYDVTRTSRQMDEARGRAQSELRRRGDTGGMFDAAPIVGWQYDVAATLTAHMIERDRLAYARFIGAIKEGKPWRAALAEDYGRPLDELLDDYANAIGAGTIKP